MTVSKEETAEAEGPTVFVANQIETVNSLPDIVDATASHRKEISWSLGPVKVCHLESRATHALFDTYRYSS